MCVDFDFGYGLAWPEWEVSAEISLQSLSSTAGPVCSHMPINFEAQSVNWAEPFHLHIYSQSGRQYPVNLSILRVLSFRYLQQYYNGIPLENRAISTCICCRGHFENETRL